MDGIFWQRACLVALAVLAVAWIIYEFLHPYVPAPNAPTRPTKPFDSETIPTTEDAVNCDGCWDPTRKLFHYLDASVCELCHTTRQRIQ